MAVSLFAVSFATWVYFSQHKMIYHPQTYTAGDLAAMPPRTVKLTYTSEGAEQVSHYVPPRSASDPAALPGTLWILYGGNASLALYWSNHVKLAPDDDAGFLLFEYPGYGDSKGRSSVESISKANDAALVALANYLRVSPRTLMSQPIRLLGHSLGAAVALDFAIRHPVDRIVLAAPFTTMRAMADRIVKPHLSWLLTHRFDNIKSMTTIAAKDPKPRILILHGQADMAIPVDMSRELKQQFPALVELVEVPHADHTSVLDYIGPLMTDNLPQPITSIDQLKALSETPATAPATDASTSTASIEMSTL